MRVNIRQVLSDEVLLNSDFWLYDDEYETYSDKSETNEALGYIPFLRRIDGSYWSSIIGRPLGDQRTCVVLRIEPTSRMSPKYINSLGRTDANSHS